MNPDDYRDSSSGRLIRAGSEPAAYWAFVPNSLPPRLDFDLPLIRLNGEAERAVGELAGLGRNLTNPQLLISPLMRREAVLSSRIEGTQTGVAGLYAYEAGQLSFLPAADQPASETDAREVLNYVRALEYGVERVHTLPVSLRLIRELHAKLMEDVRGGRATPGEFRTSQNWIGGLGGSLSDASFVPPPVAQMTAALSDLELYLHRQDDPYPPLVRLAFVHYQFEAIHPFLDGNGRIGRLLLALLLVEWRLLPLPLLYLSAFFEGNRDAYYDGLAAISRRGAWYEWATYFLTGVREQAQSAVIRLRRLTDLREEWRKRLSGSKASALPIELMFGLFENPIVTIPQVEQRLKITYPGAKKVVQKLMKLGILRQENEAAYGKIFSAAEIIQIVSERETG